MQYPNLLDTTYEGRTLIVHNQHSIGPFLLAGATYLQVTKTQTMSD